MVPTEILRITTGQTVIYLHLAIYIALGGIANTVRFAVDQALTLSE